MLLFIKFFAYFASMSINKSVPYTTDIYICHSTPNIFLWVNCIYFQPDIYYIVFWTFIIFFIGMLLDETYFIYKFNRIMISQKKPVNAENT